MVRRLAARVKLLGEGTVCVNVSGLWLELAFSPGHEQMHTSAVYLALWTTPKRLEAVDGRCGFAASWSLIYGHGIFVDEEEKVWITATAQTTG
jgi:hypothetical protein